MKTDTSETPESVEAEQARWQAAIYELLVSLTGDEAIDGCGCESGDPLDVTLTEIAIAFNGVTNRLPFTADGKPILPGMTVYALDPDYGSDVIELTVNSIVVGKAFEEYRGDFTIGADDYEYGNLELFADRDKVQ